jgi:hypothetical protein
MITISLPAPPEAGLADATDAAEAGVAGAGVAGAVAVWDGDAAVLEQAPATRPTIAIAGQSLDVEMRILRSS